MNTSTKALTRAVPVVLSLLGPAALAIPAAAQPPAALTVRALTGADDMPVMGVGLGVTACGADAVLAHPVTGGDGAAAVDLGPGCYRLEVTEVPSGCMLDGDTVTQVIVVPAMSRSQDFRFRCA